jgi:hypothetical protein
MWQFVTFTMGVSIMGVINHSPMFRRYDRRQFLKRVGAGAAGIAVAGNASILTGAPVASVQAAAFDADTGNAPIDVVIPYVIPVIYGSVSSGANDATLVLRITALLTTAWFDAIAPFNPPAVGIYSKLGHQPASFATTASKNTAILYASFRVLNSLLPQHASNWRGMLQSVDLDPDNDQQDTSTAIGVGNLAGYGVVGAREHDGMNQLGDAGGRTYNRQPYSDYTGYEPVNTAYKLKDASKWQPQMVTAGNGIFRIQQFVTPQMRMTVPYSFQDPTQFKATPPVASNPKHPGYKQQVDEVLAASAALTDYQKMSAELFDDKLRGLGFSALFASLSQNLSLDEFVHYDFLTNAAAFDTATAVWNEKHRFDAVRPFSAIRHVYGNNPVTAWGGPGRGTVSDLPAREWRGYLNTADHPEYPSGSAAFCSAHAEASRLFFGSDDFGWSVPAPAGTSNIEPGITPATDITLGPWDTWTAFEHECGLSRLWGGVHFMPSIQAGRGIGKSIGARAYEFLQKHLDGTAT